MAHIPLADDETLWHYNCLDCVRTRECGEVELDAIRQQGLEEPHAFQQSLFHAVLQTMNRGVRVDKKARDRFALTLQEEMAKREQFFARVLGHPLNPRSPLQMKTLFYEDLQQPPNYSKPKKGEPSTITCDDGALEKIATREPILRPLINAIQEYRSLSVFLSTFVLMPLDTDGRMRTSYNICGTETFRFNSSANAFGTGGNLQNIPKGGEDDDSELVLPNVREIYIPDPGYTFFDTDLSKADLRIVVWESDCREMKAMLAEGRDPYVETAREFYKDPTLTKTRADGSEHPRYRIFKSFSHGTHYLGTARGLSQRLGLTVHEAERTQRWYFGKYPAIQQWQKEFTAEVTRTRTVRNKFGYVRVYFDRIDESVIREAIAWVPQSTVAILINKIWMNVFNNVPQIQVLLQVHDSLAGQFPTHLKTECLEAFSRESKIVIPYSDPLIIPVGVKTSEKSWGDCA